MQITHKSVLGNLGIDPLAVAASLLQPGGSSDSGGSSSQPASSPTTISPTVQTQVSPQISPVFQQAFQPSGSPMTAGTQQLAPTTQSSYPGEAGNLPGDPILPGGSSIPTLPSPLDFNKEIKQTTDYTKWAMYGLLGLGAVYLINSEKRSNGGVSSKRRTPVKKRVTRKAVRRKR